ncbi:MAG: chemotaxis protein CheW [Myxococcota bacterium]
MRVIGFLRNGVTLYLPLNRVRGVYQDEIVFRYKEISNRLFGLIFLSGEVIPVVDIFKLLSMDNRFEEIKEYNNRLSLLIADSTNGLLAFIYDELKDIYELDELAGVVKIDSIDRVSDIKNSAFFVENTEVLEDIILRFKPERNNFKEIFLCPKKS